MPTPTESADLILKLYDLRREPVLREARAWFSGEFSPTTLEDVNQTVMGEKSAWFRMVVGYWDMAASLVVFEAIDQKMFNASNGELLGVFAKVEPFLSELRQQWNAPDFLRHLEEVGRQFPNADTRLRQTRERLQAKAATAQDQH